MSNTSNTGRKCRERKLGAATPKTKVISPVGQAKLRDSLIPNLPLRGRWGEKTNLVKTKIIDGREAQKAG